MISKTAKKKSLKGGKSKTEIAWSTKKLKKSKKVKKKAILMRTKEIKRKDKRKSLKMK